MPMVITTPCITEKLSPHTRNSYPSLIWIKGEIHALLFIGRQDLRKGIAFIINTLKNIKELEQPLVFIGKIEDKYRADFNQIVKQHSDKITHINEFVTESEMLKAFKLSCAIAIPYHPSFTSSSGVLVRAAAMSKPVIATDHGLVGYRVRENKLGATIKYGDTTSFGFHINNAGQLPSFDSKKCEIFKNATNFNTFRKSIIESVKWKYLFWMAIPTLTKVI